MSVALGLGLGFFVLTAMAGVLGVGLVVGYQNTVDLLRQKAELIISSQHWTTWVAYRMHLSRCATRAWT